MNFEVDIAESTPVVVVPHGAHPKVPGVEIHAVSDLWWDEDWIAEVAGMPVTSELRTAIDLAAVSTRQRTLYIIQSILPPDAETYDELGRLLKAVARRGKPGVAQLSWALSQRAGKVPSPNELQRLLHDVVDRAEIRNYIPEMPFPGRVPDRRRVDVGVPPAKLVLEADGRTWHERIAQIKNDRERDSEAHAEGVLVERMVWEHLKGDPDGTAARIRRIYDVRIQQLAA